MGNVIARPLGWTAHRISTGIVAAALIATAAHAQAPPAPSAGTPTAPRPAAPGAEAAPVAEQAATTPTDRLAELEQELAAQRAVIDAQQHAIDALKANRSEPGDGSEAVDAEAAELIATLQSDDGDTDAASVARQDPLQFYGYMDVGVQRLFIPEDLLIGGVVPTRETTFLLGNLNLYLDARPMDDWRGLAEIRFTNLPHGEETGFLIPTTTAQYERVDRRAANVTSPDGRDKVLLGSIIVERAWVQWEGEPLAKLRVGQWLTPFGIWNVDHGTPVLISLLQPDFQITQRFPGRQTGLQLLGEAASGDWTFGYHATISNGRPAALLDTTDEKALGGRLHATYLADITAKVGVSAYWGEVRDFYKVLTPATLSIEKVESVVGSEWVLGADLSLDLSALRIRTEGILSRSEFDDGKHAPLAFAEPGSTIPNHYYTNAYLLAAYQLPFWTLEPLLYTEITHKPATLGDTSLIFGAGVNLNISPTVQLKNLVAVVILTDLVGEDTSPTGKNKFVTATSRLVLAF